MGKTKVTGTAAARSASQTLTTKGTGASSRTAAGSALSQTKAPQKVTSAAAATAASKVLRDGRTNSASKTAAASALSQRPAVGKKR